MEIKKAAEQARAALRGPREEVPREGPAEFLSTGSSLLNLALTGHPDRGFMRGHYYLLVGDSASGKTFLSMTCLAEAARDPAFKDHLFIYDNVEDGMLMDVPRLFGPEVARRLRPPASNKGPRFSETVEDFYYHLDDAVKRGKPFIYVLDSMDSLSSEAEAGKFDEQKRAHRRGREAAGSYGDGKAKKNSAGLRRALAGLRTTGSILIIISQTRDAIGGAWGEAKTRAGGRALRFYATAEVWSSCAGAIKRMIRGRPRKVGDKILLQTKKNRLTGKLYRVTAAIYPSYGIDDVGSCVDFLVDEGWWRRKGGKIRAKELGATLSREKLVRLFDGPQKGKILRRAIAACWRVIDAEGDLRRGPRYA